jgi:hypothetical protein
MIYYKLDTRTEEKTKAYLGLFWYRGKPVVEASNDGHMPKQVSQLCTFVLYLREITNPTSVNGKVESVVQIRIR